MNIKIVTDSTSDIPDELSTGLPITTVPLYVNLNGKSYRDSIDLTRQEFYEALPGADPHPTTATPSPRQFIEVYDKLADEGASAIFSIHIAGSLSAVYESAKSASNEYKRIPVHAIDSGNLSMALGLIVLKAAQAAKEGKNETEIEDIISNAIQRAFAFAKLDTIEHLLRGGRISAIQHNIIGMLGIIPILKMNNYVSKMEMARTRSRAFQRVLDVAIKELPNAEMFGISHANAREQVDLLVAELKKQFPEMAAPFINEVNPALGTHVGPGTICINWLEKEHLEQPEKKGRKKWFF